MKAKLIDTTGALYTRVAIPDVPPAQVIRQGGRTFVFVGTDFDDGLQVRRYEEAANACVFVLPDEMPAEPPAPELQPGQSFPEPQPTFYHDFETDVPVEQPAPGEVQAEPPASSADNSSASVASSITGQGTLATTGTVDPVVDTQPEPPVETVETPPVMVDTTDTAQTEQPAAAVAEEPVTDPAQPTGDAPDEPVVDPVDPTPVVDPADEAVQTDPPA